MRAHLVPKPLDKILASAVVGAILCLTGCGGSSSKAAYPTVIVPPLKHLPPVTTPNGVVALLEKLVAVSEGTFQLEPEGFLNLQEHSAVLVRWWAEREGRRSDGYEIAVYRLSDGKIAEVWFYNEPSDAEAFSAVFAYS